VPALTSRHWRRRLAVAGVLALLLGAVPLAPFLAYGERLGVDFLFMLRHRLAAPLFAPAESDVVVIAVDESTYRTAPFTNTPKVLWTRHWAQILEALDEAGPKVVGFDVIYPTTVDRPGLLPGYDRDFLLALRQSATAGRLVMGMAHLGGQTVRPYFAHVVAAGRERNLRFLNLDVDPVDEVVRRYFREHLMEDGSRAPSFGVELARRAGATEPEGDFLVNFNTAPGGVPVYSMADIWNCAAAGRADYFRQHFAGKIVLIGEALDLEDRRVTARRWAMTDRADAAAAPPPCIAAAGTPTPAPALVRSSMPGVLIHAAAINTVTKGLYLVPVSRVSAFAMVALSVFGLSLLFFLVRPVTGLVAGAAAVAVEAAVSLLAFTLGAVLPLVAFAATAAIAYALVYAYRFMVEDRERRWIQHAFGLYLAPVMVERLAADPQALRLGGEKKRVTLFFSDIAGFTTISESLKDTPEKLVEILNKYLTVMTDAVKARGGYVDKYIGDAVMAIWGAPLDDPHAERNAVEAALDCFAALDRFNEVVVGGEYRMKPIGTRIGLNTGIAVVGNMGSTTRLNYTATGDTVNLAARLEGANKEYGSRIMVSEDTAERLGDGFVLKRLDRLVVKGKKQPVQVFEVVGRKAEVPGEVMVRVARFHAALDLYDAREFAAASAIFDALAGEDATAPMYAERCRHYLYAPPPAGWSGAFEMKTK
jgi:adenylate cyclase